MRFIPVAFALAVLGGLAVLPGLAHAGLGGAPSDFGGSGAVRARQLTAAPAGASVNTSGNYSINETTLDSGTVVREYVAGGQVFAVSWSGPFLPDLRTLLGARFDSYKAAGANARQRGRGQLHVERSDVVIEAGGHMRAWVGRAWLPAALPAGVDSGAIQ